MLHTITTIVLGLIGAVALAAGVSILNKVARRVQAAWAGRTK